MTMLPVLSDIKTLYIDTPHKYRGLISDFFYIQQDIKPSSCFITDASYTYKKQNNFIENISSLTIYNDNIHIENPLLIPLEINVSPDFSKKIFQDDLNYRFSDVSLYSTTPYDQSNYTVELIKQFIDINNKTILDSSACIGGNTIEFSKNFKKVYAVELYKKHVELLRHNLNLKNINNCTVINDNILNVKIDTDIIFYDPPWSNYENNDYFYTIGNKKVFLKSLIEKNKDKDMIVFKVENKYENLDLDIGKKIYSYNINDINNIPIYKLYIYTNLNIKYNIEEKTFLRLGYKEEEKKFLNYREFANIIKNKLITKYTESNAIIADIGSGKGGDLYKYMNTKMKTTYLFEPYFYYDLLKRFNTIPFKNRFKLIKSSAENIEPYKINKVNNVFMFFSLNFFNKNNIDILLKNIKNITLPNAKIIFTYMDGQRTIDLLNKNNGLWKQSNYTIEDIDKNNSKDNHKIKIYIDAETVSMKGQEEYLFFHDFLVSKMNLYGFKLYKTNTFDNEYEYCKISNETDKIFTKLYRYDVFIK